MEIRDLAADDLEPAFDIRNRSFGALSSGSRETWFGMQGEAIDERRLLAAYDGGRVVAIARINDFRQWWLGRAVRMAGVASVVVLPEARGRSVGRALMAGVLERAGELGYPLTALYPATVPIYRSVGYELAGAQRILSMPTGIVRALAGNGPYVDVRRPGDAESVRDMISGLHERHRDAGPIEHRTREWVEELENDEYFMYLAEDGFVGYEFEDGNKTLRVTHLVGGSEHTLRSLWALVGSGSSVAKTVRVAIAPDDPLPWLLRDLDVTVEHETWWMLRALDPAAAIAGRGFRPGTELDVPLRLTDAHVPAAAGDWRLRVSAGAGELVRADSPTTGCLELDANGFAALYAGWSLATIRRTGHASGGSPDSPDSADATVDAAFTARPYMLDYF